MVKKRKGDGRSKKHYKGVRMRSWGSWVSEIRAPNQKTTRIWLGSYSTAEAAARAYDAALLCLKGPESEFNFTEPAHIRVPPNAPLSAKSIQLLAAAAAANAAPSTPPSSPSTLESSWLDEVLLQSPKCVDVELMMPGGGGCSFFDPQLVVEDFKRPCWRFQPVELLF